MALIGALFSAVLTAFFVSTGLWLYGIHHLGVVLACGILAASLELGGVIAWFLVWSSPRLREAEAKVHVQAVQPN